MIWVCTVCSDLSVRNLRVVMVDWHIRSLQVNMFMPGRPGRPMSATPLRNIMQALFGVTANIREVLYNYKN